MTLMDWSDDQLDEGIVTFTKQIAEAVHPIQRSYLLGLRAIMLNEQFRRSSSRTALLQVALLTGDR